MKKKLNTFLKVFFSLTFTFVIAFYFIRSENNEVSYQNYFSKLLHNFSNSAQDIVSYEVIENWFSPKLKADDKEEFLQYKLTILSKSVGQYFKNLLQDTQNELLNKSLKQSLEQVGIANLKASKQVLKKYINANQDVKEVSLFSLEGKKLIGLRYQNIPDYLITENLILELKNKNNLLLKHGKTSFLILLTLVKDKDKPFMIISQTLHPSFFDRILSHLEMNDELFYLKDSHNYVLLDNYNSYKYEQEKNTSRPYDLYQALVEVDEKNLKIKFEEVEYSIGVIVEKNNLWGNIFAAVFFMIIFSGSFIMFDWLFKLVGSYLQERETKKKSKKSSSVIAMDSPDFEINDDVSDRLEPEFAYNFKENYEEEYDDDLPNSFPGLTIGMNKSEVKFDKELAYEEVSNSSYSENYQQRRPEEY